MTKSFFFKRFDDFYHGEVGCLCAGFTETIFCVNSDYIKVSITDKRPHQSRWKKVERSNLTNHYAYVGRRRFELLPEHRQVLAKYGNIWIKVSEATKEEYENSEEQAI